MIQRLVSPFVLAGIAFVAIAAICTQSEPDSRSQLPSTERYPTDWRTYVPTFFPTPGPTFPWESGVWGGVADDAQEAAGFARDVLTSPPPLSAKGIDSLEYVGMTVGDGKELLDPSGETVWEVADDLQAFFFVARGRFTLLNRFSETPSPTFGAYCIVVPIGEEGTFSSTCNEDIDLSRFGQLQAVPLPLPPFPTPVSLSSRGQDIR